MATKTALTLPTVHLNGTSKQSLLSQWEAAYTALDAAYDVIKQAAPNGRDYYPQGPEAYGKARAEHDARLRAVDAVKDQFAAMAQAI